MSISFCLLGGFIHSKTPNIVPPQFSEVSVWLGQCQADQLFYTTSETSQRSENTGHNLIPPLCDWGPTFSETQEEWMGVGA